MNISVNFRKKWSPLWLMTAAFLCYTGMYAVRKGFLAGQYNGLAFGGLDFKTILVISQVLGYMLSKFIGIKLISEMSGKMRSRMLVGFVSFALLMLLLFTVLPDSLKPLALFLNGLPLGMVFGLVFSYLEGRRNTELLAAALSATFIFSTGFIKSIGLWLMQAMEVQEIFMPFVTGLVFFPLFLISVWMLSVSPAPDDEDRNERTGRVPMGRKERWSFVRKYAVGFGLLVLIYVVLTVIRDLRDNFIVDFWAEQGLSGQPELVALTEIPISILVLIIVASGIFIKSNQRAFKLGLVLCIMSTVLLFITSWFFDKGALSPVLWVVIAGFALYLPYILFHTMIFERYIALLRFGGNVGFLFYTADALGYLGSVVILLLKEFSSYSGNWTRFFIEVNLAGAVILFILVLMSLLWTRRRRATQVVLEM